MTTLSLLLSRQRILKPKSKQPRILPNQRRRRDIEDVVVGFPRNLVSMFAQRPPEVPGQEGALWANTAGRAGRETPGGRELVSSSEESLELLQFRFRLVGIFLSVLGVVIVERCLSPR